jgi:hypothetical protein
METEPFYKDLNDLFSKIPEEYRAHCIILGDFNARTGGLNDCADDNNILEQHGIHGVCDQILGPYITDDPKKPHTIIIRAVWGRYLQPNIF